MIIMEDRRAHERINEMEFHLKAHTQQIEEIKLTVQANTVMTKSIETNTAEIVDILKSAKLISSFIIALAKLGAALGAIYAMWHVIVNYIRGH